MADRYVPHTFSDIDAHPDPARLVGVLHRLRAEPFFTSYKQRVLDLLRAGPGRRFLDVGAGTGDAARRLAAATGAEVTACDLSAVMCREMRGQGLRRVVVADARHLPFRNGTFDGVFADRVLQHTEDPEGVLAGMLRVVRPGGRIVVCDPDTGTQALAIDDHELAARVLALRGRAGFRHGTFARRVPGLLAGHGLEEIRVEARTLLVRDRTTADAMTGVRDWAGAFADRGQLRREEARRFDALVDAALREDRFLYAVTYFLTSATLPALNGAAGP
ncbi:hypothetical protein GCM10010218_63010 [Streptomyces mashuensis]|uniref:Methyltransferase type 11 domain-containing protein n=1 Tax=Streptomyces mashuensis TaxID=33904 RepID=A0A919BAS8_9ACTN|nr:methyltransferase domain-containing protein [Streptomyces mashuensis]GHF73199.1 hypothetical protein GCM10010218_63010 [Streptomyces mashuensis]